MGSRWLCCGTTVNASQLPLGCKAPLSRIVSGAISSEQPLPFYYRQLQRFCFQRTSAISALDVLQRSA